MKAVFVLPADYAVQNFVRRAVYELNARHGVPFNAARLPAHISLKQPFTFESMDALEAYFDAFAARAAPIELTLSRFTYGEWNGSAILGLEVVETQSLRNLHNRLNQELPALVKDASAPFDGDAYRFHMTVEMSKIEGRNGLKEYFDSLPGAEVNLRFTARDLALFYTPSDGEPANPYITYRICPLAS